jgi:hypothetical protein
MHGHDPDRVPDQQDRLPAELRHNVHLYAAGILIAVWVTMLLVIQQDFAFRLIAWVGLPLLVGTEIWLAVSGSRSQLFSRWQDTTIRRVTPRGK